MSSTPINKPLENTEKKRNAATFFAENSQKLIALSLWLLIGGGVWYYGSANNLTILEVAQLLADLFQTPFGALIFILVYAIRPLLLFSATVLTLVGGAIFGPVWGILIVAIGGNTSAMIAYGVGRYFGEGLISEDEGQSGWIQYYTQRLRQNSFETVLIMRLIFLPYDFVNYLCGFLKINWKSYLLATILGSLPGTIAITLFGSSLDISEGLTNPELNPWTIVISVVIVVVSIVISRYLKKSQMNDLPEAAV